MPARILFISYDGMTDPLGQSQVIPYLEGLASSGFQITILSAEKDDAFSKGRAYIGEKISSANIQWVPVRFSNEIPGWSAWRNYSRLKQRAIALSKKKAFNIIHCRSYIPALIGLLLKKKFRSKVIFDMRGFWADERVEGNLWRLSNPFFRAAYRFFKRKEIQFLNESDAIVSLTENGKKEILGWSNLKLPSEKITVVPCCVDLNFFSPQKINATDQNMLHRQLGIEPNDFIVSYSGSLGTWYMLEEMLRFFTVLLQSRPRSKFLFITGESKRKVFEAAQQIKIPAEKIIVASAGRNEMPLMLSLSNLSIFFIRDTFSKKASCPTKFGETVAMGIPLICNAGVGDVKEIIEESGAGICVNDFSEGAFKGAASGLDSLLQQPTEKIRSAAEKYFSLEEGIKKYVAIYSQLS